MFIYNYLYYTLLYRKRASLDDDARGNQRQEERIAQKQRRIVQSSTLFEAAQAFISAIKEGPDYVCVCCNRLMYRKTVQQFKEFNYDKAPSEFVVSKSVSAQDKQWICKTCHSALKRGVLPAQAKANNLNLDDIPIELSDLNPLEIRLISLRILFMKMVYHFPVASNMRFMGQLSMYPLISLLCVPFYQGFHLKHRWSLWSWRGSCVTRDTICTSTFDQQRYLQLYNGWNWTIHCTRI